MESSTDRAPNRKAPHKNGMIMGMEKPSRPRRPIKPRSAAQSTQIPRRDGRTRKQAETPAVDPQGSQAALSPKTQAEGKPKGLGIFTRRTPTQHTPPTQERKPGTWRKTPAERLAAATPRQRSHTTTRPTEQPRTTKKRGPEASATGNTVKVGGLEISVRALFAVIMTGLLIALVLPSMYQWARQEQEYREIVAQVEEARAKKADVERQLELWNDQDYVASQARERLGYVRPGETQYSVVDPGPEYQDQARSPPQQTTGRLARGSSTSLF